ncbi:MAG: TIGR03545 family protein, partial [Deltaproteobacteria bacterium]|nr:TIGR03545 family protein [Deltaproteobacteria bacterium]
MKMIRWGGLITFIVIIGLIAAFDLFFLDTIIEKSLERQGSLIVGARVDIGELDFSLFDLHLAIKDLQVTDPEHPMRNAVESGDIFINLAAAPLLKKKIVIENMTVRNIALNTPRKTSGALPPRLNRIRNKVAAPEKEQDAPASATNRLEECSLPDFSAVADIRNRSPEDILSGVKLKSSEFLSEYVNTVSATRQSWEKRLETLPTKESLNADLESLKELINKKPEDVTELPGYLEKIKVLKNRVQSSKQALTAAGKDFQSDMNSLRESLSSANTEKLKSQDLSAVMKKLDIKIPSSEDLVCVLVGKDISRKVMKALSWYRKLNGLMPAGKGGDAGEKPRQVPRMKGVDVAFPVTHGYPDFLLEKAELSARSDLTTASDTLTFTKLSGTLEGLTTQPYL